MTEALESEKTVGPPSLHVIEVDIGDEISLYDSRTERVVVLNITASDVWRLSGGDHTLGQITDLLALAYGRQASAISADVENTVASFISQGLLEEGAVAN